uniref:Protein DETOXIFICATION n=1 Tax=Anthurium amnicola TaxID=1678845 RepID=A0A1D1ZBF2_9ARAE
MECCARCRAAPAFEASPASNAAAAAAARWEGGRRRLRLGTRASAGSQLGLSSESQGAIKLRSSIRRCPAFVTTGTVCSDRCECRSVGTLNGLGSSASKFLYCTQRKHARSSRVSAAEQLEDLALEGDGAVAYHDDNLGSDESSLHDEFLRSPSTDMQAGDFRRELIILAAPAILGQAIDPLAQLMETAYIGRLGPVELASAGVSVSIFNSISKLFNMPLLSITTSFVAEDISKSPSRKLVPDMKCLEVNGGNTRLYDETEERERLPSVSSALVLAAGIGALEALALFWGSGLFLRMMGISAASPMRIPAEHFLRLRALGAPANVVTLAVQGVFRGFKDTTTPLFCVGVGNISAVILFPVLMYSLRLGVSGAAIATVASQYIATFLLLWRLSRRAVLLPPKILELDFSGYIKSGGLLLGRTLSVLFTMTLATSMAARQGPLAMAAHQICLQVWLAVSLLSDALALSAQALIASSFAKCDYERVKGITYYVLKTGVFVGVALAVILGSSFGSLAGLFTKDIEVQRIARTVILFVSASQPINALAFVFDGLHYGVSDFSYSALSMMLIGAVSSLALLYAPPIFGLPGVWFGLTLLMSLRMAAGFLRLQWKTGPWWFLQQGNHIREVAS